MRIGEAANDTARYLVAGQVKPQLEQVQEPSGLAPEDSVEISSLKAREKKNARTDIAALMEQFENAVAQGEAMGEAMTEKIKCLRIAMRIISGDKVPQEDHQYLAEKDPELYARALMMKLENDDPREYERISEDDKEAEQAGDAQSTTEGAAAEPEAAAEAPAPAQAPEQ